MGCFSLNVTATTDIYTYGHTLSLHDALPISHGVTLGSKRKWRAGCERTKSATNVRPSRVIASDRASEKPPLASRSEEHTSELPSLMRISYAVFCLKKKKTQNDKYIR